MKTEVPVDCWTLTAYALPGFILAVPTIPVYVYLPALYGDTFGLGLALTGVVLLFARLFDVVTDPLIGRISDTVNWRTGRRKPLILLGGCLAALALIKIVSPPEFVDWPYLLIWSGILYLGWTLVAIPYAAWGAELRKGYRERLRITSAREGAGILGIMVASALPAVLIMSGRTEQDALIILAWTATIVGVPVAVLLTVRVPEPKASPKRLPATLRTYLASLPKNAPFCRLIAAWAINGFANGLPAALFLLYLEYVLGAGEAMRPRFILVYFLAAVLAIPAWLALSHRLGKHRAWCTAMALAIAGFALVPMIPAGAFSAFFAVCILTGAALGADLALPPAIQADVVDYDAWKFGEARAGFLFALWSMATKFAQALAVGFGLSLVAALGFDPAQVTAPGQVALTVIYAWLPIVFKTIAIAWVWNFTLTERRLRTVQKKLVRQGVHSRA